MKPLWVIDIREGKHTRLEACIAQAAEQKTNEWQYTPFTFPLVTDMDSYGRAGALLLKAARVEVNRLLEQKGLNSGNFPICIIGDITSASTRSFLPFMAILLKRYWAKVLPVHAGIGVSISAFLSIPSDVNQHEGDLQKAYHRLLEELNLLKEKLPAQTYDFLIPFSDIQAVGKQAYPKLSAEQQDELIYQYLSSLYRIGAHAELPFMRSSESCFYALGASSVYYDAAHFRQNRAWEIEEKLSLLFRETPSGPDTEIARQMQQETVRLLTAEFDDACIAFDTVQPLLVCHEADIVADLQAMEAERGFHPVWHFYRALLYPTYYLGRLKYLPASLNEYLQFYSERLEAGITRRMKENGRKTAENVEKTIDTLVDSFWNNPDYRYKTLPQLEAALEALVAKAERQKKRGGGKEGVSQVSPIVMPQFLQTHVFEIEHSEGKITKQTLLEELKALLQKEPTLLSAWVKSLLLGTSGVFCLLPLLKFLSPRILNLGQISGSEPLWIALLFILPFIYTFFWVFRRHFKMVKKWKHRLLAYTLSGLQTKLSMNLAEETAAFYDQLKAACEKRLADCARLRAAYATAAPVKKAGNKETFFNRPLLEFISDAKLTEEKLTVEPGREVGVNALRDKDLYALLAHGVKSVGSRLSAPLPADAEGLKKKVEADRHALCATLLKQFAEKETLDIGHLVQQLLLKDAGAVDFAGLMALAYPSGLFVDSVSDAPGGELRSSFAPRIPAVAESFRITEDPEGDQARMFFTSWQRMSDLSSFRFLDISAVQGLRESDFSVELACYYAFYLPARQSGKWGAVMISREKLSELNERLRKWEEEV